MADVDIDPFGEHESRRDESMGETILLIPGKGGSTWEPECEQETSFGAESLRTKLIKDCVKELYEKLSKGRGENPEVFHLDHFELRDEELYYKDKRKSLTTRERMLRSVSEIEKISGKRGLHALGFDVPTGKLTAQQAAMLNRVEEELPSASDVTKADDIELKEIAKSTEDLISQMKNDQSQTDDLFEYPLRELLGLDKQLRSIRGSLKVEDKLGKL